MAAAEQNLRDHAAEIRAAAQELDDDALAIVILNYAIPAEITDEDVRWGVREAHRIAGGRT